MDPNQNLKDFKEFYEANFDLQNVPRNNSSPEKTKFTVKQFVDNEKNVDAEPNKRQPPKSCFTSEIGAMSVLSLYDDEIEQSNSMDTGKDIVEPSEGHNSTLLAQNIDELEMDSLSNSKKDGISRDGYFSHGSHSLWFCDGDRCVNFVLVWSDNKEEKPEKLIELKRKRAIFERNLAKEGLQLEHETTYENGLTFVKIHAPDEVLRRYSEILKIRLPMREVPALKGVKSSTKSFKKKIEEKVLVDTKNFPTKSQRFTAVYSRDKEYLFDMDHPDFFTDGTRSRIVQFILDRKRFSTNKSDDFAFGIERLISDGAYLAAYPLHDGDLYTRGSMRNLLYTEWASVTKFYRYQPLDYVKDYFGVKIGLYFAWLGFYTHMLIPAAVVGLACFIYSWTTLYYHTPSEDICKAKDIKMCPLCDHWCGYWDLNQTCFHARVTYLIDNPSTVFFAIFMSFWATLFLELWKRYSAEITHRWDLTGFDVQEEHPRPQYLARLAHVRRKRVNVVTNTMEPHVPFWRVKLPATILSFSIVLLLISLALVAVLAVVLYRMSVLTTLSVMGNGYVITSNAIMFTTATAATINLCLIVIFNWIYTWLAEYLTEIELLRTQTEFDDSLTLKIYLLQFVNYYASIFYIAFFKGKFVGYPGGYNRLLEYRQEECGLGGCLMELCIQLAIIMVGKQTMNTILEMAMPVFYRWLNILKLRRSNPGGSFREAGLRWVKDFKLIEWGSRSLFPEYLEMVLQYGFVTIFVAAFPLAPFFALLNNILEMRLDGKKLLTYYRRPVTQRVRDIGVWYRILDSIGKLSVITNGFIIAFTSNFIPKLVYRMNVSGDGSLKGYLDHSLAYFNTSDFDSDSRPKIDPDNVTLCRYPDYRHPPWENQRYNLTSLHWQNLTARLGFVVVFENVVALVMILVRWCIPDMSCELKDQIRREAYITNEIIIKQEAARAREDKDNTRSARIPTARWKTIMDRTLSGSELDLALHEDTLDNSPETTLTRREKYKGDPV